MKITLVGPVHPYRGGIAHYTAHLARALHTAGHQVQVISFARQYPAWLYPGTSDKDPSQQAMQVEARYLLDPLYPWTWWRTGQAIRQDAPDMVVISWWTTFWGPAFAALAWSLGQQKQPVVFLVHNVLPHEARPWDRLLARAALGQGQGFIVQTEREAERLRTLIPAARSELCPHPRYERFSEQFLSKAEARRRLGLPLEGPLVLFFGIVRPYKGLKYLIEALGRVDGVHLAAAGDFWDDIGPYQEQVESLGLRGRVHLANRYIPNEEAHLFFSAADAFAAPYVGGTQSGAVNVALAYGLPLVVTQPVAAGLPAEIQPRLHIVPPMDVVALAGAIEAVDWGQASVTAAPGPAHTWERLVQTIEKLAAHPGAV